MNISRQQKFSRKILALSFIAFAMGLAAEANAGEVVGPDIPVRYGDLSIETEQGATQLLRRIELSARRVCAPLDHGDLASRLNESDCRQKVTAAAVAKVNHPMVQAAYRSSNDVRRPMASLVR